MRADMAGAATCLKTSVRELPGWKTPPTRNRAQRRPHLRKPRLNNPWDHFRSATDLKRARELRRVGKRERPFPVLSTFGTRRLHLKGRQVSVSKSRSSDSFRSRNG